MTSRSGSTLGGTAKYTASSSFIPLLYTQKGRVGKYHEPITLAFLGVLLPTVTVVPMLNTPVSPYQLFLELEHSSLLPQNLTRDTESTVPEESKTASDHDAYSLHPCQTCGDEPAEDSSGAESYIGHGSTGLVRRKIKEFRTIMSTLRYVTLDVPVTPHACKPLMHNSRFQLSDLPFTHAVVERNKFTLILSCKF